MTRRYHPTSTGWKPSVTGSAPPTSDAKVRLTSVSSLPGTVVAPPGSIQTIFGMNTDPRGSEGIANMRMFGRVPIGRTYVGGSIPADGSFFAPGGFGYNSAGLQLAGVTSDKRLNMSYIYDPRQVTSDTSSIARQVAAFCQSVPVGWEIQFVMYHEYNLHTNGPGGRNDAFGGGVTNADFAQSFRILSQVIEDNGNGRVIPVINPVYWGWQDSVAPPASEVAATTQFHWDLYDNPNGNPSGYKQYGTQYHDMKKLLDPAYAVLGRLGYLSGQHGWGVNEFNCPRRVAPKLATLNTTLGWGPLSPYDIDGSQMAAAITAYVNTCLAYPVPPTTLIIFIFEGGTNFNQSFTSAGRASVDDGTAANPGPNYQGWPIQVDPSRPKAAWQHFIDISA